MGRRVFVAGATGVIGTNIPTGARALRPSGWATNNRLRTEAASNFASAATEAGASYVGESLTFPYHDSGDRWVDETVGRSHSNETRTTQDAEAAAERVTAAGGTGVILRFAMFWADDSRHNEQLLTVAKRLGTFAIPGKPDAYLSWIHIDDAATAAVAAMDAPPGVYNVAEAAPTTRAAHAEALAKAFGKKRLRPFPMLLQRAGGKAAETIARSQRISSAKLTDATDWSANHAILNAWSS